MTGFQLRRRNNCIQGAVVFPIWGSSFSKVWGLGHSFALVSVPSHPCLFIPPLLPLLLLCLIHPHTVLSSCLYVLFISPSLLLWMSLFSIWLLFSASTLAVFRQLLEVMFPKWDLYLYKMICNATSLNDTHQCEWLTL